MHYLVGNIAATVNMETKNIIHSLKQNEKSYRIE